MDFDFSCVETPQDYDVEILDAKNNPAGLRLTICPKTSERYQKAFRWAQDQFSNPKARKMPKQKQREIEEKLFCSRISGWKWHGQLSDAEQHFPFNSGNVRKIIYGDTEFSAMIRNQVAEVIEDDENFRPDE